MINADSTFVEIMVNLKKKWFLKCKILIWWVVSKSFDILLFILHSKTTMSFTKCNLVYLKLKLKGQHLFFDLLSRKIALYIWVYMYYHLLMMEMKIENKRKSVHITFTLIDQWTLQKTFLLQLNYKNKQN